MSDVPEAPVTEVVVRHEDGTVRRLEGEGARAWAEWVARSVSFTREHGGRGPDVEWEESDE